MASTSSFYGGADYGLNYQGEDFLGMKYKTPFSDISLATNPFTANQIQEVSNKLNTGAKSIEVNLAFVDQQGAPAESIPDQHLEELNRLKKLTGVDFTMHGALVEPTGMGRQGWDESQRQQAERQMWISLQKSKKLDPDGNIVVTFHSSNGLPEPESKVIDEYTGKEKTMGFQVIDELTGKIGGLPITEHHFPGQENLEPVDEIKKINEKMWNNQLQQTNYQAFQGAEFVETALKGKEINGEKIEEEKILKIYKVYTENNEEYQKMKKSFGDDDGLGTDIVEARMRALNRGSVNLKDSYSTLKGLFDTAYSKTQKQLISKNENDRRRAQEDMKKLNEYKNEIAPKVKDLEDPSKISEFSEEIIRGINLLSNIAPPETYRPIRDFAIDKASETFSNLAVRAFDKYGDKSPVISIENPPAGSGLSRAEDLKELIEESRKKFVANVIKKYDISEDEAKKQANKVIGATWDLGHINMLRKYGYDEDQKKDINLIQQTETIAPYIKNVHLSDNFGMEHTELPMGMGNVPTKLHLDIINKFQAQVKKVVETGNWYQHFGQNNPPIMQTAAALGSGMFTGYGIGPSWGGAYSSATASGSSGYFAGYGMNPDIHHSVYGAGFSGLPTELGGQIPGRNSRLSGTAME